jgi:hypothetical protein
MLDQGGKLYNGKNIIDQFSEFNYEIFPTRAMSSFQNGAVKKNQIKSCSPMPILMQNFGHIAFANPCASRIPSRTMLI